MAAKTCEFEEKRLYIITETDVKKKSGLKAAFKTFKEQVESGRPGLAVIRTAPNIAKKNYELPKDISLVWITSNIVQAPKCFPPADVPKISHVIISFLEKNNNGIVFFEGLEYLISQNDYKSILNLVQLFNDKVMVSSNCILLYLDPKTLSRQEYNMFKRDMVALELRKGKLKPIKVKPACPHCDQEVPLGFKSCCSLVRALNETPFVVAKKISDLKVKSEKKKK